MKNILFYGLIIMMATLMSCEERFTQVVEFDLPEHDSRIVTYCFSAVGDQHLSVELSKSSKALEKANSEIVESEIQLYKGDELLIESFDYVKSYVGRKTRYEIDTMWFDSIFTFTYTADITSGFIPNEEYTLKVASPGLKSVESKLTVPSRVKIEELAFSKDSGKGSEGYTYDEITIDFVDPPGVNYYVVAGVSEVPNSQHDEIRDLDFQTNDVRINESNKFQKMGDSLFISKRYNSFLFFSDEGGFDNRKNSLKFEVYDNYSSTGNEATVATVRLFSITKDMFQFLKSNLAYTGDNDNPFSEPVGIYCNIDNGFGMFAISNYDEKQVKLQ